jgi:hypothetical protein
MSVIAGLRTEITNLYGAFAFFSSPFNNTYTNWIPSITYQRVLVK